jgi:hypothetical protein
MVSFLYHVGLFIGLPILLIISYLWDKLMLAFFKLEPLSASDFTFLWNTSEETFNMLGIHRLEGLNPEGMRKLIIEKGIKQFRKLRSKVTYKFLNWWWEEQDDVEEVIKEVFSEPIRRPVFNSREEVIQYGVNELKVRFDLSKQIPYRIIFVQNEESSPEYRHLVIFKYDHILTDGLGITGLTLGISDNYSIDLFPPGMVKKIPLYYQLMGLLYLPYYAVYNVYRNLSLNSGDTPFKMRKPLSGEPVTVASPALEFATYNTIRNHLGITFNDLMMAIFSSTLKKYCAQRCSIVPKKIITLTPISSRPLPKDITEIKVTNDSTGIACELYLHDDPITEAKSISEEFKKHVRNIPMANMNKLFMDFLVYYFPAYLVKFIFRTASKNFDITYSNIPGPRQAVYYDGYKLLETFPIFTTGFGSSFIAINSYNGMFRITITFDKSLEQNPNDLLQIFLKELEYVRDNYDKKLK